MLGIGGLLIMGLIALVCMLLSMLLACLRLADAWFFATHGDGWEAGRLLVDGMVFLLFASACAAVLAWALAWWLAI